MTSIDRGLLPDPWTLKPDEHLFCRLLIATLSIDPFHSRNNSAQTFHSLVQHMQCAREQSKPISGSSSHEHSYRVFKNPAGSPPLIVGKTKLGVSPVGYT